MTATQKAIGCFFEIFTIGLIVVLIRPKINRISLTYCLTSTGTVRSEYTIIRKNQNEFYLISAGALTDYDKYYLIKNAQEREKEFGYVEIQDVTSQFGAFAIAGPKSKEFMISMINDKDPSELFSNENFSKAFSH